MGKIGLVVNYNGHWDGAWFMGSSPFAVCVTTEVKHDELLEKIYRRVGVSRDRFELKLSTMANTKTGKKILPIMYDGDVEFVIINAECTPEIFVEVVERPASFSKDTEDDTDGEGNGKEGVGNTKADADMKTFWTCCSSCGIRYENHRTSVNIALLCPSCHEAFTAYNSKVPSQEKEDGGMKGKEGVRMHKTDVSNGKPKPDGGKPGECGTSRNADKKRKIMSEGESSGNVNVYGLYY